MARSAPVVEDMPGVAQIPGENVRARAFVKKIILLRIRRIERTPDVMERFHMAPMAEITTPALRRAIRRYSHGAVLYSEMLSAGAIAAGSSMNREMSARHDFDDPFVFQIVGAKPAVMAAAAARLAEQGCRAIDINMGCSAPDIMKTGGGAALLADPPLAREIVRACRSAAPCGLTVKMRSGYERTDLPALLDFARMLQDEGVNAITLHGRHAKLGFRRTADWSAVRAVKERLSIPVIGNGDIDAAETAVRRLRESGCDGVMIGRAAVQAPWIFALCDALVGGGHVVRDIDIEAVFVDVLEGIRDFLEEKYHRSRGHRFCFYFCQNVHFSHELFRTIRRESAIDAMIALVRGYFARNPHERVKTVRAGA
ncbi:MAG TPA: tRNA-dihydrouridine synthase family protein [Spirochaetota bacterium]|nr:tRNA-dihydrouridine synthase family protein [Spirochaetota bacterium]